MENFKANLESYADYLEANNCEFVIIALDKGTNKTSALMSKNSPAMLASVFDKSKEIYELFNTAEKHSIYKPVELCLN